MVHISLDRHVSETLSHQLYQQLQQQIISAVLPEGYRLPSSRILAGELQVSRNLVTEVYDTLRVEGYIESRTGSGTYVAGGAHRETVFSAVSFREQKPDAGAEVMKDGAVVFEAGIPADLFPRGHWGRCLRDAVLYGEDSCFGYGHTNGLPALQDELRKWLAINKGICCHPEQILLFPGTHASLVCLLNLFSDLEGSLLMEDPLLPSLRSAVLQQDPEAVTVPMDDRGLRTDLVPDDIKLKAVLVTPSHSYPLSALTTIQRRLALVQRAERDGGWIIENDYDGELIFRGPVVNSIHMLSPGSVIHTGSFSGTLFPGIKMSYMVVPEKLLPGISACKADSALICPGPQQLALARFIGSGYYDKHIIRLKKHFSGLYHFLADSLISRFGGQAEVCGIGAGQYLTARFPGVCFTESFRQGLEEAGLYIAYGFECTSELSSWSDILIFNFGQLSRADIEKGLKILHDYMYGEGILHV